MFFVIVVSNGSTKSAHFSGKKVVDKILNTVRNLGFVAIAEKTIYHFKS